MTDNDQNLKAILCELVAQFFELFLPEWADRFDFESVEWLQQELFPDPLDGERRSVDLLGKLSTREPLDVGGHRVSQWLSLLHVEIEGRDATETIGRRMHRYYTYLRDRHDLPVLPIVVFLHVGLEGVGIESYKEDYGFAVSGPDAVSLDVLEFRYLYVGLPGLNAIEYLDQDKELGIALASLMKIPEDRRAWFKAEALQRLGLSSQSDRIKEMLWRFVEIYVALEPDQESEFDQLMTQDTYEEARLMGTTYFERGIEQGIEQGLSRALIIQLERRFGSLTDGQREHLAALSNEQLEEMLCRVLTAQSLSDLELAE